MTPSQKSAFSTCLIILKHFLLVWLPLFALCATATAYLNDPSSFAIPAGRSADEWMYIIVLCVFVFLFLLIPLYLLALLCFYIKSTTMTVSSILWRSMLLSMWFAPACLPSLLSGDEVAVAELFMNLSYVFALSLLPSLVFVWLTQRKLREADSARNPIISQSDNDVSKLGL